MKTICIMCPVGCHLEINKKNNDVEVTGNTCPRGLAYGKQEVTNPTRVITSVIKTDKGTISVKTTNPVPKHMIADVLLELKKIKVEKPKQGSVLISNVLNTGADIVVTGVFE